MIRTTAILFLIIFGGISTVRAQFLPCSMTDVERSMLPSYVKSISSKGFTNPPNGELRNVAEWEEMDAIVIAWESYTSILTEIVRAAVDECDVYILTQNQSTVNNALNNAGVNTSNVHYINTPTNSVWIRDYGPNNVYIGIDSLIFIDWIYNRPRPDDDASPAAIASAMGIPLYETTQPPTDLVNTGGNYFSDGFGTSFATELVLEENQAGNPYSVTAKTEADIDTIFREWMGIDRFIKFTVLPYDGIHHIDMHMKMLNEETILVAEYPTGVADGPQIEANIQYLQNNYLSVYGTPYKIVRIPSPPSPSGLYPDDGGYYRTYTNSLIINKTVIIPTYYEEYDTTAVRIYREAMPGYRIVSIDCDDSGGPISASGAIHCITHEIATTNPLMISHQALPNTSDIWNDYIVDAKIFHKTGISNAYVYYTTDTLVPYQSAPMTLIDAVNNIWSGSIPAMPSGTTVYYYIQATSVSGKTQVRPMPAPDGYWKFFVYNTSGAINLEHTLLKINVLQNDDNINFEILADSDFHAGICLYDILGNLVFADDSLFSKGSNIIPVETGQLAGGIYTFTIYSESARQTVKVFVK